MRLLFDHNLSRHLVRALGAEFPGSVHVSQVGLDRASDVDVWTYAAANGLAIVSKDNDFQQRSFLLGHPPKVIWIRRGNCSTRDIEDLLRRHVADLAVFDADPAAAVLVLS